MSASHAKREEWAFEILSRLVSDQYRAEFVIAASIQITDDFIAELAKPEGEAWKRYLDKTPTPPPFAPIPEKKGFWK